MSDYCNSEEWLAAYLDKRLTDEEYVLYEKHLSKCSYCLTELISAKIDLDEIKEAPAFSREIVSLELLIDRLVEACNSRLRSMFAGLARFRWLSAQFATSSVAIAAAIILGLGFFQYIASPGWDPDFKSGRSGIRKILSVGELGKLRISGGRTTPATKATTIRGTGIADRELLENTQKSLNKVMSKYPQDAEIYTLLGHMYLAKNLLARAEVSYNMARLLNPKDAKTFNNLAVTAYRKGDIANALDYLEEALRKDDIPLETYYNLGILYHETGNEVEMRRFFEIYLEHDPDSPWAERARSLLEE